MYDAVDRQILWLNVGLVAALLVAGGTVVLAVRRSIIALQQVSAERRALSWRMIRLQEDVQAGLARELHDEFGQVLTALGFGLSRTRRHVEQGTTPAPAVAGELAELQDLAKQVLDGIRQRSRALHPVVLDDFGLEHAMRSHVELVGAAVGPADRGHGDRRFGRTADRDGDAPVSHPAGVAHQRGPPRRRVRGGGQYDQGRHRRDAHRR